MRKVAVVFGGKSNENEISILSGIFVMKVLEGSDFTPVPVYIHTDGELYSSSKMRELSTFQSGKISPHDKVIFYGKALYRLHAQKGKIKKLTDVDVALNCCHGGLGEGGGVSALTALNGIPFASPDILSSAVFMDKDVTKTVMKGLGVPVVEYIRVGEKEYEKRGAFLLKSIQRRLKYPVVIKPVHLGSSIGIIKAENEEEAKKGIETGFALDDRLIIEKYLTEKTDVNCAAYSLNGEIFVSEPQTAFGGGIYSFEEKYIKRKKDVGAPAAQGQTAGDGCALNAEFADKIRSYTKTVYKRLNMQGVVRMDYLIGGKQVYLCEVNTVPGSLAYYLFCDRMIEARAFFCELLCDALARAKGAKHILTTGILQGVKWNRK
ncbi:MAG: hypothetical protein IJY21_02515 [Clostridia bacterium]|nr:hypothetical protein [Clostridia bacterium]